MSRLLLISSNLTGSGLKTRRSALRLIDSLRRANPGLQVIERNLYAEPIPARSPYAFAGTAQERLSESQRRAQTRSDALIAEVEASDTIVIAAPMQNLSIPATLKSWIDHIARAGRTFRFTPDGPVGLLKGKTVFVVSARSSYFADGLMSAHDFHEPYLRAVLRALGMEDVSFLYVEDEQVNAAKTASIFREPRRQALAA